MFIYGLYEGCRAINDRNNLIYFGCRSEPNITQSVCNAIASEEFFRHETIHIYRECFDTENRGSITLISLKIALVERWIESRAPRGFSTE